LTVVIGQIITEVIDRDGGPIKWIDVGRIGMRFVADPLTGFMVIAVASFLARVASWLAIQVVDWNDVAWRKTELNWSFLML
jgi:hypothetical protein